MAAEIELKLTLPTHQLNALRSHPLLAQQQRAAPTLNHLYNCYFDTPDQLLNQHAVALRIRRKGERFIQTLKTRGTSQGGLHQRQEWEWERPNNQLDLDLLPRDALPAGIDLTQLRPAFHTDFERTTWELCYGDGQAEIELVLDLGEVRTERGQTDPIREIELELKAGPADALIGLATRLAEDLPLRVCRISKAERGYRLGRPDRAERLPARPRIRPDQSPHSACYALADATSDRLLAAIDGYEFLHEPALLIALHRELQQLTWLLTAYAAPLGAAPLANQLNSCRQKLEPLITPLLLAQATECGSLPGLASTEAAAAQPWLESRALGQALLALSTLLYRRPWQPAP